MNCFLIMLCIFSTLISAPNNVNVVLNNVILNDGNKITKVTITWNQNSNATKTCFIKHRDTRPDLDTYYCDSYANKFNTMTLHFGNNDYIQDEYRCLSNDVWYMEEYNNDVLIGRYGPYKSHYQSYLSLLPKG